MSKSMNSNPLLQDNRLTPLVSSSKTGRLSNERKNRSVLYEATTMGHDTPANTSGISDLYSSENLMRAEVTANDSMDNKHETTTNMENSELLINILKEGMKKK